MHVTIDGLVFSTGQHWLGNEEKTPFVTSNCPFENNLSNMYSKTVHEALVKVWNSTFYLLKIFLTIGHFMNSEYFVLGSAGLNLVGQIWATQQWGAGLHIPQAFSVSSADVWGQGLGADNILTIFATELQQFHHVTVSSPSPPELPV